MNLSRDAAHDRLCKLWRLAASNANAAEAASAAKLVIPLARLGWFRYTVAAGTAAIVLDRVSRRVSRVRLRDPLLFISLVAVAPPRAVFAVGTPAIYLIRVPLSEVSITIR